MITTDIYMSMIITNKTYNNIKTLMEMFLKLTYIYYAF